MQPKLTRSQRSRRSVLRVFAAGGLVTVVGKAALAQSERPVRLILPVAAGSGVDTMTRAASQAISKALGHPVVIDNQPGAGGLIGTQALIRSAPDGFTLGVVSNNHVVYPAVLKPVPFDPLADVTPITVLGSAPLVLAVNPKVPARNAQELIALLKEKPGILNYASSGNGTIPHLAAAMFLDEAVANARHIPYKGVGPMLTDVIGGQAEFCVVSLGAMQQYLKSGALRAIGICAAQRSAAAPELPTFREQGLPNYVIDAWFAVVGPKDLPASEIRRLHAALVSAYNSPEVKAAMEKQGNTIAPGTPEQARAYFRSELVKFAALVKKAGIEPQ